VCPYVRLHAAYSLYVRRCFGLYVFLFFRIVSAPMVALPSTCIRLFRPVTKYGIARTVTTIGGVSRLRKIRRNYVRRNLTMFCVASFRFDVWVRDSSRTRRRHCWTASKSSRRWGRRVDGLQPLMGQRLPRATTAGGCMGRGQVSTRLGRASEPPSRQVRSVECALLPYDTLMIRYLISASVM
jgi:hypothetical protein